MESPHDKLDRLIREEKQRKQRSIWDSDITESVLSKLTEQEKRTLFYNYDPDW